MQTSLNSTLVLMSALSFLAYGSGCFFSPARRREFHRYGLASQRMLVGGLQISAAGGLIGGLSQPWMGRAASIGLALMMLVAVGVRVKIMDTLLQMSPAMLYLALNTYLFLVVF